MHKEGQIQPEKYGSVEDLPLEIFLYLKSHNQKDGQYIFFRNIGYHKQLPSSINVLYNIRMYHQKLRPTKWESVKKRNPFNGEEICTQKYSLQWKLHTENIVRTSRY